MFIKIKILLGHLLLLNGTFWFIHNLKILWNKLLLFNDILYNKKTYLVNYIIVL